MSESREVPDSHRRELVVIRPLFAAGFVTAFGAHSIAATLGLGSDLAGHLLALGVLLALYDGAEVLLKPVFGALADRIGPRPVLLGGLLGFAVASAGFVLAADQPAALGLARLAQGAAAAAFSPAAGTMIARIAPNRRRGRAFGSYGAWKGLGYALGPIAGGVLLSLGGYRLLFLVLTGLAVAVAGWAAAVAPRLLALPRARQTVLDLARRLTARGFLVPTLALASATAALSGGVGFLPVIGARAGLGPIATGAAVSVLAATAALSQPAVGRLRDTGGLPDHPGIILGLLFTAAGCALPALAPHLAGLLAAAALIGIGTGVITPLAFATLASGPPERMGQTMGAAEIGRELGDAGGPLLIGSIATLTTLAGGFLGLAAALLLATAAATAGRPHSRRA